MQEEARDRRKLEADWCREDLLRERRGAEVQRAEWKNLLDEGDVARKDYAPGNMVIAVGMAMGRVWMGRA